MLFFRLARFLALPILPVFVFDGPAKPNYKRNKKTRPGQHTLTGSFKAMIEAFGFEWHQVCGPARRSSLHLIIRLGTGRSRGGAGISKPNRSYRCRPLG